MTQREIYRKCVGVFILGLLICGWTFGQTGTTSLRGAVMDKSSAAIVGASVKISNALKGFERATTTGAAGEYEFLALPPGSYTDDGGNEEFPEI